MIIDNYRCKRRYFKLLFVFIGSLQNGWINFLKVLENGFSRAPWKWMENIDLLSSVLKLEVGGNCWRQQQLHSAWVLSLEFEKGPLWESVEIRPLLWRNLIWLWILLIRDFFWKSGEGQYYIWSFNSEVPSYVDRWTGAKENVYVFWNTIMARLENSGILDF